MTSQKKGKNLLDQQVALHAYLDDLLQEVPDGDAAQSEPTQEPELKVQTIHPQTKIKESSKLKPVMDMPVLREIPQVEPSALIVEPKVEEKTTITTSTTIADGATVAKDIETQPKPENKKDTEVGMPDWAQERFQCLLFKVAGITLAVPLVKLNGVLPWDADITPMPGHSRVFLGLLRHLDQNVQVVDTAQVVLPERQQEGVLLPLEQRLNNVILIGDGRWGLACDGIGEVITLEPEEVRWRTSKGKLKWLAGTVLQHLCALLEVDSLANLLKNTQDSEENPD